MKKLSLLIATSFVAGFIGFMSQSAVTHAATARSLKDIMSDMGGIAKALSAQISNKDQNTDSAAKAESLRTLILEAVSIEPEKVANIPDKAARQLEFLEFQKAITALYSAVTDLEENFLNGDNAKAVKSFSQIRDFQKQGHDRFRIPE